MEPFANYPLIRTDNADKAEAILSNSLAEASILDIDDHKRFRLLMNGISLGRTSFIFNRYDTGAKIRSELSEDSIYLIIGSKAPSTFKVNSEQHLTIPEKGIVISNERWITIDRPSNSEILVLRVAQTDLHEHFERLINNYNKEHLSFECNVNMGVGSGALLKRLIDHFIFELHTDDLVLKDSTLRNSYDDMILTAMLSLPHNLRDRIHPDYPHQIAPAVVYRAEEYMMAHLTESITISDLLKICNCSRSALFLAFQKTRGYSPMVFITEQRLQHAREMLSQPNLINTVSRVAQDNGFRNFGRFSQMYKRRFGESPSETLQNSRRI